MRSFSAVCGPFDQIFCLRKCEGGLPIHQCRSKLNHGIVTGLIDHHRRNKQIRQRPLEISPKPLFFIGINDRCDLDQHGWIGIRGGFAESQVIDASDEPIAAIGIIILSILRIQIVKADRYGALGSASIKMDTNGRNLPPAFHRLAHHFHRAETRPFQLDEIQHVRHGLSGLIDRNPILDHRIGLIGVGETARSLKIKLTDHAEIILFEIPLQRQNLGELLVVAAA